MIKARPPLALIAGPTASGKSALALALAERAGGTIINADSAQVYADLRTLSARPSDADTASVEHRLFGVRDAGEPFSAADWALEAAREIGAVHARGRLPVLVGGTGLYLRTLLEGIAPVPPIDEAIRAEVRDAPVAANHRRLMRLDSAAAARLDPADTTRVARALEVVLATGRTLSSWQSERSGGLAGTVALRPLVLLPPRDWLYRRCDERFATMLDDGAIDEVRALLARGLESTLPAMRAIGVREIAAMLAGESTREDVVAAGARATRNYAKRQYTWFSNQPPADWPRFREPLESPGAFARALALLGAWG